MSWTERKKDNKKKKARLNGSTGEKERRKRKEPIERTKEKKEARERKKERSMIGRERKRE